MVPVMVTILMLFRSKREAGVLCKVRQGKGPRPQCQESIVKESRVNSKSVN